MEWFNDLLAVAMAHPGVAFFCGGLYVMVHKTWKTVDPKCRYTLRDLRKYPMEGITVAAACIAILMGLAIMLGYVTLPSHTSC